MTRILLLYLTIILLNITHVCAEDTSICRSEQWEQKFREISRGSVEIIAVCPKKNSFYVEVMGNNNELSIFKRMLRSSDMGIVSIQDWGETGAGATLLRVGVNR